MHPISYQIYSHLPPPEIFLTPSNPALSSLTHWYHCSFPIWCQVRLILLICEWVREPISTSFHSYFYTRIELKINKSLRLGWHKPLQWYKKDNWVRAVRSGNMFRKIEFRSSSFVPNNHKTNEGLCNAIHTISLGAEFLDRSHIFQDFRSCNSAY